MEKEIDNIKFNQIHAEIHKEIKIAEEISLQAQEDSYDRIHSHGIACGLRIANKISANIRKV